MTRLYNRENLSVRPIDTTKPSIEYFNTAAGVALRAATAPVGSILVNTNSGVAAVVGAGQFPNPVGGVAALRQTVTFDEFTDGGSDVGTLVLDGTIPVGAWALRTTITNVTGFAGDASAALTVGDGSDVDRYNTSTINVFGNSTAIDGGAISGTAIHATAISTVTLTITTGEDFSDVNAGQLTVNIYYLN